MINIYYLSAFIAYFAFFLGLSFYFYRKTTTASSFMIGARSMNYWVTALSTQASDMSDWLFMAYPGLIYAFGLFDLWVAIGLLVFMFLNWHFIAPRLRHATEHFQALTLASFFEKRLADSSHIIRLLTVFFTLFFITYYIAAELIGLGRLFETTFGIEYNMGIAISMVLVVLNILLGGFVALAWSDMFRGIFLLIMIILVPWVAISHSIGFQNAMSYVTLHNFYKALVPDYGWTTISKILLLSTGWGLGYFGSPHILINFMGIKDVRNMYKAKYIGLTWQTLVLGAATVVGLVGTLFFANSPLTNRELVFVEMVRSLFTPLFAGFILCAILAATMSVMTAQILATASIVAEDLVKRLFRKSISEALSLAILRACIILLPLIAYAVSFNSTSSINDLVSYAWSGLGLSFAPTVIASLFLPFAHRTGCITAMLLGGLIGMFWPAFNFGFMPLLPGFILCMTVLIVVSWFAHKKESA